MRKLTKTIAIISLLSPTSALPVGIGDIKLHSSLNQKLDAEIDLVLSPGEKPENIRIHMATPEKFDEAGVPWTNYLSKIRFNTVVQPNGQVLVKLSSNEAFMEPFLDFVLEVSWESGSLFREFTVLVDPPVAYQQPVTPVIEQSSQVAAAQQPTAETISEQPIDAPSSSFYGPVAPADTLWQIAEQVKPAADVSTEQMMMAIYEANPQAFFNDNVNLLKSGENLQIPDRETILKLSKSQAAKLFSQHMQAWRQPDPVEVAQQDADDEPAIESKLELEAPLEQAVSEESEIVQQENVSASEVGTENSTLSEETLLASENSEQDASAAGRDQEIQLLNTRLEKLEKQLEIMQKLLVLKDEQLAALQKNQSMQQPELAALLPAERSEPAKTGSSSNAEAAAKTQTPTAPSNAKNSVDRGADQTSPDRPAGGFFSEHKLALIGGGSVLGISLLGLLWWRRNKEEELSDTESMFASSSEIAMPDSEVYEADQSANTNTNTNSNTSYDVGTVGESSFLSEFTPSDFDAFDSDHNEVDPIQEADVYLAYGRYQQAEDLIRQVIQDEPQREDSKLKLLEIFYASENKVAFEDYVRDLAETGMKENVSFWHKVVEMGKEIIPESAELLAQDQAAAAQEDSGTAVVEAEENIEDITLDTGDEEDISTLDEQKLDEQKQAAELPHADDMETIDFDLDFMGGSEAQSEKAEDQPETLELDQFTPESTESEASLDTLEFSFDENDSETDIDLPKADEELPVDLEQLDLGSTEDSSERVDQGIAPEESENSIDFSLEDGVDESSHSATEAESSDQEFDFDFDFDLSGLSSEPSGADGLSVEGEEFGVSDLTDMDEIETKIDLAKAYIDMGETETAKSIAEEVIEKGSEEQQNVARSILAQLDQA